MANVLQARTEFASALNQVAHERNLDPQVVLDTIKQAIIAAFRKDHPDQYDETLRPVLAVLLPKPPSRSSCKKSVKPKKKL